MVAGNSAMSAMGCLAQGSLENKCAGRGGQWWAVSVGGGGLSDAVRPVAAYGDKLHLAAAAGVVADRQVLDRAVVPECHGTGLPPQSAGELRARRMGEQELEQRRAFGLGPAGDALGVEPVDEQAASAGLGMHAHHRM